MFNAQRMNGKLLDDIFQNGVDSFQAVFPRIIDADEEPEFLKLNIGGQTFLLLVESLLRADNTSGFLTK